MRRLKRFCNHFFRILTKEIKKKVNEVTIAPAPHRDYQVISTLVMNGSNRIVPISHRESFHKKLILQFNFHHSLFFPNHAQILN